MYTAGILNSIKIHALSLPLASTQTNDRFFLIAERDNISVIQNHKTENRTEATSLLEEAGSLLAETPNSSCKAGIESEMGCSSPYKEDETCFYPPLLKSQRHTRLLKWGKAKPYSQDLGILPNGSVTMTTISPVISLGWTLWKSTRRWGSEQIIGGRWKQQPPCPCNPNPRPKEHSEYRATPTTIKWNKTEINSFLMSSHQINKINGQEMKSLYGK